MKRMTVLIAIVAIMSSCTNYPKCSQEDTVKLALGICIKEIKYELAYNSFYKEEIDALENSYAGQQLVFLSTMLSGGSENVSRKIEETKEEAQREIRNIIEGESFKKDKYLKYVRFADSLVGLSNIQLTNIRTTDLNKELKKCNCKADFVITGAIEYDGSTLNYTAQLTDDGSLFVEVETDF